MSHQPSTIDRVKENASSAYETVANTIVPASQKEDYNPAHDKVNITKDAQGGKCAKGDYKDQLNKAAHGKPPKEDSYVEKGVSTLQQSAFQQGPERGPVDDGTPPTRPDHDVQVEEFLRTQYKSVGGAVGPDGRAKN